MLNRTKYLAAAAAVVLSAGLAHADGHEGPKADTVVASVDGANITLGQLIMLRSQLPAQYQQLPDDVVFNGLVEQLINQQLLANSLEDVPARVEMTLENERRSLLAGEVVNALTEEEISEADLQAAYDARFADQEPGTEYNASHILVETEEEALEVIAMIEDGADFATTAQEKSTGPSGPNGGNLGWFGPGMMVAPFEEAVATLEVEEVSAPVQTQFGWHVVKLNDTRETALPTLDEMRAELTSEIQQAKLNDLITSLTDAAEITLPEDGAFDPALIQNLDLLDQ
ncbi:peptidylprolyl isomerase [Pseudooctadecabacter jejudonensis]|uniref:Parvulin-like PPIase n=1 Tax=Pseudooctadecabacter jejudonensis TaxID=1391910 RepID=A0A1Y5S9I2_9RHOB|nr:peptidylprolyl isomerase [Pseudooctadecabacter jejudonensis]SLN34078.1 putative parvulin-type peptidyl-prolyl cis-trans isomerase precursor [Pseudooctadecabacter jejudonensis]